MVVAKKSKKARSKARPVRSQDPEGTRQNIIEIASEEFALNGLRAPASMRSLPAHAQASA